jgi:hypothetical protein
VRKLMAKWKNRMSPTPLALVSDIAFRGLSISGSEVARQLKVDRSAACRAARRVENGADLAAAAARILKSLGQS